MRASGSARKDVKMDIKIEISEYKSAKGKPKVRIAFSRRPHKQIRQRLIDAGFRWNFTDEAWDADSSTEAKKTAESIKAELLGNAAAGIIIKAPVREIKIASEPKSAIYRAEVNDMFTTWKEANEFISTLVGQYSIVYYDITWDDGKFVTGKIPLEPTNLLAGKTNILSDYIHQFWTDVLKGEKRPVYGDKEIAFAKGLLAGYLFDDSIDEVSDVGSARSTRKTSNEPAKSATTDLQPIPTSTGPRTADGSVSKQPVKIIEITTAFQDSDPDFDVSGTFSTWKEANSFVASLIENHSNAYYKVTWQDGQHINGVMDLDSPNFFDGKKDILSEHLKRFYTNVSKAGNNDPIFDSKAVAFTKMILEGYSFEDAPVIEKPEEPSNTRIEIADTPEENDEPSKPEKENHDAVIREFYRFVVNDPKLKDPLKVTEDNLKQWLSKHYPSYTNDQVDAIIKLHRLGVIGIKKNWIRKTGEPIKRPYSTIYDKLHKVIPDLEKHLKAGVSSGKSKSGGYMDLNFDYLYEDEQGYVFALSHYYKQNGDMIADPDMQIRLIPEMKMAEALTFQDYRVYHEVYHTDENGKNFVRPRLKKDLNSFLSQWLTNLINQRHKIDLSKSTDERCRAYDYDNKSYIDDRNIIFNPVVMARYANKRPFFHHIWKDKYDLSFLNGNEFSYSQLIDLSVQFNTEVLENEVAEDEYMEEYEDTEDKAYSVPERESSSGAVLKLTSIGKRGGPFTLKQSWTNLSKELISQLAGFINTYPGKLIVRPINVQVEDVFSPISEIVIESKDRKHRVEFRLFSNNDLYIYSVNNAYGDVNNHQLTSSEIEFIIAHPELMADVAHSDNTNKPPIDNANLVNYNDSKELERTIIMDIQARDRLIPGIMNPIGAREPFASQNFMHKEMLGIVKEKFRDLAVVTDETVTEANAIQLFELVQLDHPHEYPPLKLSRSAMLREWERRGEELFLELGLPVDRNYPYVNIHVGYSSVYTLGAIISERGDHDKWWSAAGDHRPVGDLKKALTFIDESILELHSKRSEFVNSKTKKPKGKNLETVRDIDFKIKRLERSKEVIEDYINGDSQEQIAKVPEELRSSLWNQNDDDYPNNKITIKEIKFHQALLRNALAEKIKSLPVNEAIELAGELSHRFKERRPYEAYGKGLVTIGKKGEKRELEIIWTYVDDIIIDHDLSHDESKHGAMEFLLERLYPSYFGSAVTESRDKPEPKNQHELNKAIERFIDEKDSAGDGYNENDKNYISQYTGSGGLISDGASGQGILYEFYTPYELVQRMWGLAFLYGFTNGNVFEPACGTGRFFKYVPVESHAIGFEVNGYAKRIAEILYPWAEVVEMPFESIFFAGNVHLKDEHKWRDHFDLIIGNPPYGPFSGKYAGMGEKKWTGATQYDQYFMLRCLDLLKPGGLLVFLIPSAFLDNDDKYVEVQKKIDQKAELIDAYRLPNKIFPNTDWGTDIIVLRKKQA
jgi:uncharacterized protein YqiB (DUF1249 family)/SAM-dependent methyltransferase